MVYLYIENYETYNVTIIINDSEQLKNKHHHEESSGWWFVFLIIILVLIGVGVYFYFIKNKENNQIEDDVYEVIEMEKNDTPAKNN